MLTYVTICNVDEVDSDDGCNSDVDILKIDQFLIFIWFSLLLQQMLFADITIMTSQLKTHKSDVTFLFSLNLIHTATLIYDVAYLAYAHSIGSTG